MFFSLETFKSEYTAFWSYLQSIAAGLNSSRNAEGIPTIIDDHLMGLEEDEQIRQIQTVGISFCCSKDGEKIVAPLQPFELHPAAWCFDATSGYWSKNSWHVDESAKVHLIRASTGCSLSSSDYKFLHEGKVLKQSRESLGESSVEWTFVVPVQDFINILVNN